MTFVLRSRLSFLLRMKLPFSNCCFPLSIAVRSKRLFLPACSIVPLSSSLLSCRRPFCVRRTMTILTHCFSATPFERGPSLPACGASICLWFPRPLSQQPLPLHLPPRRPRHRRGCRRQHPRPYLRRHVLSTFANAFGCPMRVLTISISMMIWLAYFPP